MFCVSFRNVIIACILQRSVSQDEDKSDSWPRGLLKIIKGKDYQKKSIREATPKFSVKEDNEAPP